MLTSTPKVADPVYVKYGDISTINGNIHILLFNATNSVTFNKAVGVQRLRSVFKISDDSAQFGLIKNGLRIDNYIRMYDENPYCKNTKTFKITVRDLPIEFNNCDLLVYLKLLPLV